MPAGIAQARAIAAPNSTATPSRAYQARHDTSGRSGPADNAGPHHGANKATGRICNKIAGPLASTPTPIAKATPNQGSQDPVRHAATVPWMPASAQAASIMSNIVSVWNTDQKAAPTKITGANVRVISSSGQIARARRAVHQSEASANSGATKRGHQSLTPNTDHPAFISQNSNGGLW